MESPVLWMLIAVQVAMGAFDTLFHHEGTERLAWRPEQKQELRLHGVRNLFYAAIFVLLGWFEPRGTLTALLSLLLIAEVVLTLWDFVEEDRTRNLPATERVTHTLLALNYGAILALAAPVLSDWAGRPTAIVAADYGYWSLFASAAAFGVAIFGVRDLAAAARIDRILRTPPACLADRLDTRRRILVTGGTGFVRSRLVTALVMADHDVTVLTRRKAHASHLPAPIRVITGLQQISNDDRFDCIVNLAGEPVANGLWTRRKRRTIVRSRLQATRALVDLVARLETKPECLISGSAVGWYGLREDEPLDETAAGRDCFVHRVCRDWERAASRARVHGVRVVCMRTGLVLGAEGGMLARLLTPFEFGLGGPIGSGQQWMPWIALDDMVRLIVHLMAAKTIAGPVNATAPAPVRNADFARSLGRALNRPAFLRVPAAPLRLLLRDFAEEMLLGGQRVLPAKALASGFEFKDSNLDGTLRRMTGQRNGYHRKADPRTRHRLTPNRLFGFSVPRLFAHDPIRRE